MEIKAKAFKACYRLLRQTIDITTIQLMQNNCRMENTADEYIIEWIY